jgi:hypothetical protein
VLLTKLVLEWLSIRCYIMPRSASSASDAYAYCLFVQHDGKEAEVSVCEAPGEVQRLQSCAMSSLTSSREMAGPSTSQVSSGALCDFCVCHQATCKQWTLELYSQRCMMALSALLFQRVRNWGVKAVASGCRCTRPQWLQGSRQPPRHRGARRLKHGCQQLQRQRISVPGFARSTVSTGLACA